MCILVRIGNETTTSDNSSNRWWHLGMDSTDRPYSGATEKAVSRASLHKQHRDVSEYQPLARTGGGLRLLRLGNDGIAPCNPYNPPTASQLCTCKIRYVCGVWCLSVKLQAVSPFETCQLLLDPPGVQPRPTWVPALGSIRRFSRRQTL